jgi:hypothetical protein
MILIHSSLGQAAGRRRELAGRLHPDPRGGHYRAHPRARHSDQGRGAALLRGVRAARRGAVRRRQPRAPGQEGARGLQPVDRNAGPPPGLCGAWHCQLCQGRLPRPGRSGQDAADGLQGTLS